jgi:carboxymethylenebutenolidase
MMSEVRGADPRLSILDMPVPIHPGEYVREEVLPKFKNSLENAAHHIGVASTYLQTLIEEKTDLTIEAAIGLGEAGEGSPLLWMDLQVAYSLWKRRVARVPGGVIDPSRVRGENMLFTSGDDTIKGYLARPSQAGQYPGIVVIHEAFGLVGHIRDIARRFANIGFNALAPDLYTRSGSPEPDNMESVSAVTLGLPDAEAVRHLEAAAGHLRGLSGATSKVGAIGFCSGGRQSLLFACSSSKVDAAIDCWGGFIHRASPDAETTPARPTPILNMIERLNCPLFAVFGEEDQNPTVAQSEELRSRAQRAGKDVVVKVYKNAGHAFIADYRPSFREGPAQELWRDVVAFFLKHLKT